MTTPRLVVLPVSPWSERAKWALDHHGLPYEIEEHVPFLGERRLRRLVGPRVGPATVPVLLDGDAVIAESWDIARYADARGSGTKLIPKEHEGEVRRWVELADRSSTGGRGLVVSALLASPRALDEGVPQEIPAWVRPLLRPVNRFGTRWFARKYGLALDAPAEHEAKVRAGLDALRAGLAKGPYLLGAFSYADLAMATLLQGVSPVADEHLPLGPATRMAWTRANLAVEYADLLRWRDALYREHRRARVAR